MTLEEFLRREVSLPPYPGACCRLIDKWILERAGFSALSRFGRDYQTDEDVERWLAEPGGIAVAVNRVMRKAGLPKTKEPRIGDVGLVFHGSMDSNGAPLRMAVLASHGWVSRDDAGLSLAPKDAFWKAWRIE